MNLERLVSFLTENDVTENDVARAINDRPSEVLAVMRRPILLEYVRTVKVPAFEKFVAAEEFAKSGFRLSNKAKKLLLPVVDVATPAGKIQIDRLKKGSDDGPIKAELGDRAEISAAHFVATIWVGHKVVGEWIIAYLKELPDWTVAADWLGDEWRIRVYPVTGPFGWCAGCLVLSSDSGA